eukprot:616984-Amphidinium_carterae.1
MPASRDHQKPLQHFSEPTRSKRRRRTLARSGNRNGCACGALCNWHGAAVIEATVKATLGQAASL